MSTKKWQIMYVISRQPTKTTGQQRRQTNITDAPQHCTTKPTHSGLVQAVETLHSQLSGPKCLPYVPSLTTFIGFSALNSQGIVRLPRVAAPEATAHYNLEMADLAVEVKVIQVSFFFLFPVVLYFLYFVTAWFFSRYFFFDHGRFQCWRRIKQQPLC